MKLHPISKAGFTLVEVLIATLILVLTAGLAYDAYRQFNNMAVLSRLMTVASATAQNQITQIQTATPFVPQKSEIPPILQPGTTVIGGTSLPIYSNTTTGLMISGTMTTIITSATSAGTNGTLYNYGGAVQVQFQYQGTTYTILMNTIRTSDS